MPEARVLYLSREDVAAVDLPMSMTIDAVGFALAEKAHGRAGMPPKHWLQVNERRFFSAMTSAIPAVDSVVCKWQSGSSDNARQGLPYLTGMLMLNDLGTGLTVSVMDSTWITAMRTAAASAVAARHLAPADAKVLAIIGCGIQGRLHVDALRATFPRIEAVRAYDVDTVKLQIYAGDIQAKHGIDVTRCGGPRDAADGADIVVTGGPIEPNAIRSMEPGWLGRGKLGIAIDYDCYWKPQATRAVDRFFVDDVEQMEHLKSYGYFLGTPAPDAEIGAVVAGLRPGRQNAEETLLVMNMGIAVEDVVMARRVFDEARNRRIGRWLDL